MSDRPRGLSGPDLATDGVTRDEVPDGGMLVGHAGGEPILLARAGDEVFALSTTCSHYGGPLEEGVFDGSLVRCPWHHACFEARTGRMARPPALDAIDSYEIEERAGRLYVGGKRSVESAPPSLSATPSSVVIIGGGAAGNAAAETLGREGYRGPITLVSAETNGPVDRPNLSKDYLAGSAQAEWIPLRPKEWYAEHGVTLALGERAVRVDADARRVVLSDGRSLPYGALLLATGAEPIRLDVPGGDLPHVHYLRTLEDSDAIIRDATRSGSAVVIGASFIGLEVAASLRKREIETHVVAPETVPMEKVLGEQLGAFVRALHEEHGVRFHLGRTVARIDEEGVTLDDGTRIGAGLVAIGVGVRPVVALAEQAGLALDRGVVVDEYLATSAPNVWAAGDIARWPDAYTGERIRVEHWVVAERQGQTAARNMLGRGERFDSIPFFWSQHYDVAINYVGHAEGWDRIDVAGDIGGRDCLVAFRRDGRTLAIASIFRDEQALRAELAMERHDESALRALVPER